MIISTREMANSAFSTTRHFFPVTEMGEGGGGGKEGREQGGGEEGDGPRF